MPSPSSLPSQPRASQGLPAPVTAQPPDQGTPQQGLTSLSCAPTLHACSPPETLHVLSWVPSHPVRIHQHVPPQLPVSASRHQVWTQGEAFLIPEIQPPGPWWPSTASAVPQPSNVLPGLLVSRCALCGLPGSGCQVGKASLHSACWVRDQKLHVHLAATRPRPGALYLTQHSAHCKLLNRVFILFVFQ